MFRRIETSEEICVVRMGRLKGIRVAQKFQRKILRIIRSKQLQTQNTYSLEDQGDCLSLPSLRGMSHGEELLNTFRISIWPLASGRLGTHESSYQSRSFLVLPCNRPDGVWTQTMSRFGMGRGQFLMRGVDSVTSDLGD